jgi:hypothetical protein
MKTLMPTESSKTLTRWQRIKWTLAHDLRPKAVIRWVPKSMWEHAKKSADLFGAAVLALAGLLVLTPLIIVSPVWRVAHDTWLAFKGGNSWHEAYNIIIKIQSQKKGDGNEI